MTRFALVLAALVAVPAFAQGDRCTNCGVIQSIEQKTVTTQWTPLGSVAPGTVPGESVATGQVTTSFVIGKGLTNDGMVVLGSAGGGGYAKRPNSYQQPRWEITIKMDNGPPRVVQQAYEPALREGDRVRVYGTQLELVQQ